MLSNVSVNFDNFLLEGSQAFFSCPQQQALSHSTLTSATCTSSGEWSPDLSQLKLLQCESISINTQHFMALMCHR